MRKLISIIFILLFMLSSNLSMADEWSNLSDVNRSADGQKTVTNKEFEDVVKALEERKNKKELKQKKKRAKKISGGGTSLHTDMNPDSTITELQSLKNPDDVLLVNLPVDIYLDGKILEKGYYNAVSKKGEDGKIVISLYQSEQLCGTVEGYETKDDFGEQELNFAKIQSFHNSYAKLIIGTFEFNCYAYLPYLE
ncbi:MAG: hypothetical protein MJ237_06980 [bacterium]|nr:hypothetical protein [bacterium]